MRLGSAPRISRRDVLLSALALGLMAGPAKASAFLDLDWDDLLPEGQAGVPSSLQGLAPHDESDIAAQQPVSSGVRTDWNGKIVRLPGFIVPIQFEGSKVAAFILVPFVGACVHVPPPPANQLVLVTAKTPYEFEGLFDPVLVTGLFGTAFTSTELAEVGYALAADRIEPFV